MGLLDFFRTTPPKAIVSFDDDAVTCRRSSGLVESVQWSELQAVLIQTTDSGPAVDDVFWVLAGQETGCVVPSEAVGMNRLLERLQRLPEFGNRAVLEAMGCTDNREFVCWRRKEGSY